MSLRCLGGLPRATSSPGAELLKPNVDHSSPRVGEGVGRDSRSRLPGSACDGRPPPPKAPVPIFVDSVAPTVTLILITETASSEVIFNQDSSIIFPGLLIQAHSFLITHSSVTFRKQHKFSKLIVFFLCCFIVNVVNVVWSFHFNNRSVATSVCVQISAQQS